MSRGRRSRDRGYISGNRVTSADAVHAEVNFLVVAGGGGGGVNSTSGGGAGGVRSSITSTGGSIGTLEPVISLIANASYVVTVGAGGAGGSGATSQGQTAAGVSGSNSVLGTITSLGGGYGALYNLIGGSGGSGGGPLGIGTPNQGHNAASNFGGGGGAGGPGLNHSGGTLPTSGTAGAGGPGVSNTITGSSIFYGGGGGGSGDSRGVAAGAGGIGGGGAGSANSSNAVAGTANTGGGGGASAFASPQGNGGAGGSGVVILRYPNVFTLNIGAGLSYSTQTVNDDKVTTFTSGSGSISLSPAPVTTGDYESIATVLVGSAGASTVTFSNIPQIYKHLQLRILARTTFNGTDDYLSMRFNGDSGTNYTYHNLFNNAGTVTAAGGTGQTLAYLQRATAATAPANTFGLIVVDIPDYANVSKNKIFKMIGGWETNSAGSAYLDSGAWLNTNAISSVQIFGGNASSTLVQYSYFALYGIRG